jgi:hypothetical protein
VVKKKEMSSDDPVVWGRKVKRVMTLAPSTPNFKKPRGKWTEDTMTLALQSIRSGQMTQREAGRHFNIPESTIRSWRTKKVTSKRLGPPTALTANEESALVTWCIKMQDIAHCVSVLMLKTKVKQLTSGRTSRFRAGMPGKKWWNFFSKRHPELVLRTPQGLDGKRAKYISPERCALFYSFLARTYEERSYSATHIWNMDETGVSASMDIGGAKVIARRGSRSVLTRNSANREWLTIVACVSASGQRIPCQYIFSGMEIRGTYIAACEPGAVYCMQRNGWQTSEHFIDWLQHFQTTVPGGVSLENPHLLLLDGHASHLTKEAIMLGMQMGLQIALLPPHSSHRLQPLDVGVFRAFKMRFGQLREEEIASNPGWLNGKDNKTVLATLVSKAMVTACNPENIRSGFKRTGIFPFNAHALDKDYGPSFVFDSGEKVSSGFDSEPNETCNQWDDSEALEETCDQSNHSESSEPGMILP